MKYSAEKKIMTCVDAGFWMGPLKMGLSIKKLS